MTTKIRGDNQIKDGTIRDAQIASDAAIDPSKIAGGVATEDLIKDVESQSFCFALIFGPNM